MTKDIFYSTRIAGRRFDGVFTKAGPGMAVFSSRSDSREVPLGEGTAIREKSVGGRTGLWICDGDEPMIDLARFNEDDIQAIVWSFGVRIDHPLFSDSFFSSLAWESLKEFAAKHPRKAKVYAEYSERMPGWLERAAAETGEAAPPAP